MSGGTGHLRILLTGGFGFIGMHLIRILSSSNDLVVFDSREDRPENAFRSLRAPRPVIEIGDIRDENRVNEIIQKHHPEAVVHLAAVTGVVVCEQNPSLAFSVNVPGTYNVIMGCVLGKSRLIFLSSKDVYGETLSDLSRESDPLLPKNVYGLTKMLGERLIEWAAAKHDLDYTILRPTFVYGPGGDKYNIQVMLQNALEERTIRIWGGGQRLDLLYVEDLAETIRRCLILPQASRQTLNVGRGEDFSAEETARKIASSLDIPVKLEKLPMNVPHSIRFRPSLELLEKTLGYRPETTFSVGLQKTIEWYATKSP